MRTQVSSTTSDNPTVLYNAEAGLVSSYTVTAESTNDQVIHVIVGRLHNATHYDSIPAGQTRVYRVGFEGINRIVAWQAASGTNYACHGAAAKQPAATRYDV